MNRQLLENVFVTALEGGSNYWYQIGLKSQKDIREAVPKQFEPYFAMAMLSAVLDHGVEVDIYDVEDEDNLLGTISAKTIQQRLDALAMNNDYSWALDAELDDEGDAESSDVIFQYLVIGEVWFS
jgi:hypothetical protein